MQHFALGRILGGVRNEQPGKRGDGVGVGSGCVGDRYTVVGRHILRRTRRRRADRIG